MAQFSTKTSQQKEIFVYDRRLSQPLTIYVRHCAAAPRLALNRSIDFEPALVVSTLCWLSQETGALALFAAHLAF